MAFLSDMNQQKNLPAPKTIACLIYLLSFLFLEIILQF